VLDCLERIEIGSVQAGNVRVTEDKGYVCLRCGIAITEEEYETYGGLCEDCYEIEIAELDFDDGT
jgi:transcription initiation factor IIE alpha subunit